MLPLLPSFTIRVVLWYASAPIVCFDVTMLSTDSETLRLKFQDGNRIMMFSYGSGLSATMWSLRLTEGKAPFSLSNIAKVMNIEHKLKTRTEVS